MVPNIAEEPWELPGFSKKEQLKRKIALKRNYLSSE